MAKRKSARLRKKLAANQSRKVVHANASQNMSPRYRQSGGYNDNNTKRDVWEVAGLKEDLTFADFYNTYRRHGLAHAGIMKPVERCWKTCPIISDGEYNEGDEQKGSKFEQELEILINEHRLFERLVGLDYRQRVGRYGGIVIISKESAASNPDATKQLKGVGIKGLVKLMPVFESQIDVSEDNDDITSADFGNPKYYDFRSDALGARSDASKQINLHPSRVFAYGEGADDGSIYGKPAMEAPYNALMDWEKVRVSASEGFYKNAKQRVVLNIKDQVTAAPFLNEDNRAIFDKNVDDFGKGWDSSLLLSGMDAIALQSAMMDPTGFANMILQEIVAGFNIPKTILIGFETGERSSTENSEVFNEDMMTRRENSLTHMITGLLWQLIDNGIMTAPESGEIHVTWDDLLASSDTEKLENATKLADINQKTFTKTFTEEEIREAAGYDNEDFEEDEMLDDEGMEEDSQEAEVTDESQIS